MDTLGKNTTIGVFAVLDPAIRVGQICAKALTFGSTVLPVEPQPGSKGPMVGVGHCRLPLPFMKAGPTQLCATPKGLPAVLLATIVLIIVPGPPVPGTVAPGWASAPP